MDKRYGQIVIIGILLLTAYAILLTVYNNEGIGWDFVDNYLGARTLLNGQFYSAMHPFNVSTSHTFQNGSTIIYNDFQLITARGGVYVVFARAPLPWLFIAFAMLIYKSISIQLYIFVLLLMMAISIFFVSKKMELNPLILAGLIFSYFVVRWTVLYNSEELLSISFLFLFIGLITEKDKLSGIGAAFAGLAKFTNLILLPMLLLLSDKKKIIFALTLFAIITLPFIAYMYLFYGYSLISYQTAFIRNIPTTPVNSGYGFVSLVQILAYPALILIIVMTLGLLNIERSKLFASINPRLSQKYAIAYSFMFLSIIGFIVEYPHVGVPMRFGYMPYASIALFTALVISSIGDMKVFKEYNLNFISQFGLPLISFLILLTLYLQVSSTNYSAWLGPAHTKNPDILHAAQWIHNSSISNCAIVSNIWPFMNFYNITAYSSDQYCNSTQLRLPYLISTSGVNAYCGYNIEFNTSQRPETFNFTVALPASYICLMSK